MADLPSLTPDQVAVLVPQAANIQRIDSGGQKLVFRATIDGNSVAIKFAKIPTTPADDPEEFASSDIAERAKREVDTMRQCTSSHMVKVGPIGLTFANVADQRIVYFSEEFIVGRNLRIILQQDGRFAPSEVAKLGTQMGSAIKSLWELRKIHRDVKPANIMRREPGGDYILLDAGLAFDVDGESLSVAPVGTPAYFSPEQFEFTNRRTVMDFRSDMFSLGVTMYYLATGQHPFWSPGDTSQSLYSKITGHMPPSPGSIVSPFPDTLDEAIMKLLGKSPHLRFRTCDQLIDALQGA